MSIVRPTFHESWYRVGALRPTLRPRTQIVRQSFRGRRWFVLHDPIADTHHRLSDGAYRFLALLDGERAVQEAWEIVQSQLGDDAPTQGEAIRVLGQLANANLLGGEFPADADVLLARAAKRRTKETQNRAKSYLFLRIPIWDPDRWLESWGALSTAIWSAPMLVAWVVLLGIGVFHLIPEAERLAADSLAILKAGNLLALYLAFVLAKFVHEVAHGSACKGLLLREGLRGGVHTVGIMLLVLFPMPYVDASASAALSKRRHRITVAGAGMMGELALASIAAIVWARSGSGSFINTFAFNLLFVGSVSTILFNLNPLLRFDGYYILSDLLGIANMGQKSREMLHHFVKRRLWGVRASIPPTVDPREARTLLLYALLSSVYRFFLLAGIIAFVANQLFFIGLLMAGGALLIWFVAPTIKFVVYLFSAHELAPRRSIAVVSSAFATAAVLGVVVFVPLPDSVTLTARVEPQSWVPVRAQEPGFVLDAKRSRSPVGSGAELVHLDGQGTEAAASAAKARRLQEEVRYQIALQESPALASILRRSVESAREVEARWSERVARLSVEAQGPGTWRPHAHSLTPGRYVPEGEFLGILTLDDAPTLAARADRSQAARIASLPGSEVLCRPVASPGMEFPGVLDSVSQSAGRGEGAEPIADFFVSIRVEGQPRIVPNQSVAVRIVTPPRSIFARVQSWVIRVFREQESA